MFLSKEQRWSYQGQMVSRVNVMVDSYGILNEVYPTRLFDEKEEATGY
jgi:hypothetical protein